MPADGIRLGVDFGTSNTVAVVHWPDGRARPLLFDGSPLLPSAVYAESPPGGGFVVGRDAVHSARLDPARFEPNPKRRIDDGTVLLGEREVPVAELIAAVLGRVTEEWTRTVGAVPPQATLTCPAVWGATRRTLLADAASAAGLGTVRMVAEPVAAATYFARVLGRRVPVGSVVVVHDFGAGTFDASVVARTSSGFEVLAVDGRDDIGGIDVDAVVIDHLEKVCSARDPQAWRRLANPSTVEERRAKQQLWDDVRVAKERLSRNPAADLLIPLAGIEVHLTRVELEALAEPILAQTVRVTQGVLRWANVAEGRIAGVFLVGGSSRIPLAGTLLHRALGEAPVVIEQPELVVAEGSVVAGALTVGLRAPAGPGPATGLLPKIPADAWGAAGPPAAVLITPAPPATPVSPAGGALAAPAGPVPPAGGPLPDPVSSVPPAGGSLSPVAGSGSPAGVPLPPEGTTTAERAIPVDPWAATAEPLTPTPHPEPLTLAPRSEPSTPAPSVSPAPSSAAPSSPGFMPTPGSGPVSPGVAAQARSSGRVIVPGAERPGRSRSAQAGAAPTGQAGPTWALSGADQPAPARQQQERSAARNAPQSPYLQKRAQPARTAPRRRGRVRRVIVALLITLLLIAVPIVAGVIAYRIAKGESPLPSQLLRDRGGYSVSHGQDAKLAHVIVTRQ